MNTKESKQFLKKLDYLIELVSSNKDNIYLKIKLNELKTAYYSSLNSELNEQHKTYINLIK